LYAKEKKGGKDRSTPPLARSSDGRQWCPPVPLGATARARIGRGAVEAKRVRLGLVTTFIWQGEGKGSGDQKI
jgi:hypothetical protein